MATAHDGEARERPQILPLHRDTDVVRARHAVREEAVRIGLDLVSQTKVITAASELARNTVLHGHGGTLELSVISLADGPLERVGLRLVFADNGPGIADIDKAMTGGWSSGTGLGLGLPGSRRLVHEFDVQSPAPGGGDTGTVVSAVMWRRT